MNIDWKLLREQKEYLISMANEDDRLSDEIAVLDGIVHLIDHIQDEAAANSEIGIKEVFGHNHESTQ